jgi:outer membrane cobalamin receptor
MNIPGVNRLEAQFAVRAENYSDFGSTVNPKIGFAWSPIPDWLLVRGSYSTASARRLSSNHRPAR